MMPINRIIVALDRSEQTPTLLQTAEEFARNFSASLLLCHCLDWEEEEQPQTWQEEIGTKGDRDIYGHLLGRRPQFLQRHLAEAREWLSESAKQLEAAGISPEIRCLAGSPGVKICQLAAEWQADLIIMGRRGLRGASEALLGSISNHVLHHADCSVLVVQDA